MRTICLGISAACLAGIVGSAFSGAVLLTQERVVVADALIASATDFGVFNEVVDYTGDDGGKVLPETARASQSSSLSPDLFTANALTNANGGSDGSTSASSTFDIRFRVDETTSATFNGSVRGRIGGFDPPGWSTGYGLVRLSTEDGTEIISWYSPDDTRVFFADEIILDPGVYTVFAHAHASGPSQDSGRGSFDIDVVFESICAVDLNADGVLDLADLQAFVAAFIAADPLADFNADGVFDLADIQQFVNAFVVGCPGAG